MRRAVRALSLLIGVLTVVTAHAVDFERIDAEGKTYTVCRVDLRKERLELFLMDGEGIYYHRFERLAASLRSQGRRLLFAMNGGMYHPDFSPVGLFVSDGREFAPLNLQSGEGNFFLKPNGVFLVTPDGARVVESSAAGRFKPISLATQSGPLLVLNGNIHPAFRPESQSRLHRNGVGVHSPTEVVFALSETPVNFHEFARLFRDRLKCPNALFLDGTVSSLYSATLNRSDFKIDLGPIIGVAEPSSAPARP